METSVVENPRSLTRLLRRQLSLVPVSLFGAGSALASLSVDWRLAGQYFGISNWISTCFLALAVAVIGALWCVYCAKAIFAPGAVRDEFHHPVVGSLFGLLPLSLIALPGSLVFWTPRLALVIWALGAGCMVLFTWFMVARWMTAQQPAELAHPAWIVPAGGIVNVPLAAPALQLKGFDEAAVLCLSVGLFLSMPIFTLVLNRLMYHAPLPKPLRPALLILTAPFSIGYSAYVSHTGANDLFAQSLFSINLFLMAVFLTLLVYLPLCCPFRISWWSIGFPLAASTGAAFRSAMLAPGPFASAIAAVLLSLSTCVILWLLVRTLAGLARGELETLSG